MVDTMVDSMVDTRVDIVVDTMVDTLVDTVVAYIGGGTDIRGMTYQMRRQEHQGGMDLVGGRTLRWKWTFTGYRQLPSARTRMRGRSAP